MTEPNRFFWSQSAAYRVVSELLPYRMSLRERIRKGMSNRIIEAIGQPVAVKSSMVNGARHPDHCHIMNLTGVWRKSSLRGLWLRDEETVAFLHLFLGTDQIVEIKKWPEIDGA